jgi:hypothetical protein
MADYTVTETKNQWAREGYQGIDSERAKGYFQEQEDWDFPISLIISSTPD